MHLAHRDTLLMLVRDMTLLTQTRVADRFRAAIALTNKLVCGPESGLSHRVRASQVVAGLADPVVLFVDVPIPRLRQLILDGARALLGGEPPQPRVGSTEGRPRPRAGGRPAVLSAADAARVRELHAAGWHTATELADR